MAHTYIHADYHDVTHILINDQHLDVNITEQTLNFALRDVPVVFQNPSQHFRFEMSPQALNFDVLGGTVQYVTNTIIQGSDQEVPYNKEVDQVTDQLMYVGESDPGTLTSAPNWRIKRIQIVTDGNGFDDIVIKWADGTGSPVKIWDNRASYTYS